VPRPLAPHLKTPTPINQLSMSLPIMPLDLGHAGFRLHRIDYEDGDGDFYKVPAIGPGLLTDFIFSAVVQERALHQPHHKAEREAWAASLTAETRTNRGNGVGGTLAKLVQLSHGSPDFTWSIKNISKGYAGVEIVRRNLNDLEYLGHVLRVTRTTYQDTRDGDTIVRATQNVTYMLLHTAQAVERFIRAATEGTLAIPRDQLHDYMRQEAADLSRRAIANGPKPASAAYS
jgi:hypothetical protein